MDAAQDDAIEELSFEEALERLEELVRDLEQGDLSLEDSLERFERGVRLVSRCSERLRSAELRVRQLTEEGDGPVERPLDPEEDE
jgi:exodeoxyribonuclease VII small subunit